MDDSFLKEDSEADAQPAALSDEWYGRAERKKELTAIRPSALHLHVGITGLEPATSRPPDVCATNCAKSRSCS